MNASHPLHPVSSQSCGHDFHGIDFLNGHGRCKASMYLGGQDHPSVVGFGEENKNSIANAVLDWIDYGRRNVLTKIGAFLIVYADRD